MAQIGMNHHHSAPENFGSNDGWVDINNGYSSSQHTQSPIYEQQQQHHGSDLGGSIGFGQRFHQQQQHQTNPPVANYIPQRISPLLPHTSHQQLQPLIMPSHPTWPSMITNPGTYAPPPVAIPASAPPLVKGSGRSTSTGPRKTLTDHDRRRMCQYHEENPSVKQTEIGAIFGVERSTVSKVLRQKEKHLFPEDRGLSPVKRTKGKSPDIEKALSVWVKNSQRRGDPITDNGIKDMARMFLASVGTNENLVKTSSASWLEKFKQKNGISHGRLNRRASESNISDGGSLNPESAAQPGSQTHNGISPTSPGTLPSTSPLSATKSDEDAKGDQMDGYFNQGNGSYRHSNSQSTTSLSSMYTDTGPSSFSGGPASPTTPFTFSPNDQGSWITSQHSQLPLPGSAFQRPRSQTFPTLGIDPSFIPAHSQDQPTPNCNMSAKTPSSALDSPIHELPNTPYALDQAISPHSLHHSSSNGSMAPPSSTKSINCLQSPPPGSSAPVSPTQDDARQALDTLLNFFQQAPNGLVDQSDYLAILKLTDKLHIQTNQKSLPGGLHRIAETENEPPAPKMEQTMSADC
ncbi:hypothetical protein BJ878DRAFT_540329 [Calycina marina]|uniref:HTH CENPB-type domain-containing protein n=1 Tax=Calycina marina TaxID=1763456 RepID=A0A9P8CGN0_9HELO|nr:hypothetical protein BJ878DRAFT_540329 [Calycina marina]